MSWCYGLVEIGNELKLCEVYFSNKKEPMMYLPLNWKDIHKKDAETLADDIHSQISAKGKVFYFKEKHFDQEKQAKVKKK